ncbi:ankyrin repeat domain-containing protein [Neobacillus niacini]|uniref:ankyrin repeat domain-containing protein n=1 Tax=Neobacillus niacini TaxID=86668 RepID=UPI0007ABDF82|nr:ankyrin repeat domain-containing protein [Neobacillus niacini]MEC1526245.1 ankyrin repeat domain-containing protein [Neobacillus niacini]
MPTEKADIFTLARFGDLESFKKKFVLEDINKKNEYGNGLLHYSIAGNKFDISMFLIKNGIDVNMTDADGNTSLHLICEHPNLDVAKEIFTQGGDLNIRNKFGNNAVWAAVFNCKGRYYYMVELFMKYNPDTTTKNKAGRSPLDFAKQVGNDKLVNLLEK